MLGEKLNGVLNLIINGLPSKLMTDSSFFSSGRVLNLIINGLPSKLYTDARWTIFDVFPVLNLIINGLPSKPKLSLCSSI